MGSYAIGLDFGTESVRALLVDVATGETIATAVEPYADGVIDERLPGATGTSERLPPDWALQNPADWMTGLERTIRTVARRRPASSLPTSSASGSTSRPAPVLPTNAAGTPLCQLDGLTGERHAWPKLWKHHGAEPEAERVTSVAASSEGAAGSRDTAAASRPSGCCPRPSKSPSTLRVSTRPRIASSKARTGWCGQLTGSLARNACAAGYKGNWHKREGYPSREYLSALRPGFEDLTARNSRVPSFRRAPRSAR